MPRYYSESPVCDIELLLLASQSAYRVKKDDKVDILDYGKMRAAIDRKGYRITEDAIAPKGSGGTGASPLAASCLVPVAGEGPIVIAFRGTKTSSDIASDLLIGTNGIVEKKFRDAAFEYYKKIQAQYPNREIVLTGHSLGGNLAQYVAAKACNTHALAKADGTLPDIQVRTFNTAPAKTTHGQVFNSPEHGRFLSRFVNYRLSNDLVSDLPLKSSYGNVFSFPTNRNKLAAHYLDSMLEDLPPEVLAQKVGNSPYHDVQHNLLEEQVLGMFKSYQCRVDGQFFSKYRQGAKNLEYFSKYEEKITRAVRDGNYAEAITDLAGLGNLVSGKVSKQIVRVLKASVETLRHNQMREIENIARSSGRVESETTSKNKQPVAIDTRQISANFRDQLREFRDPVEDRSEVVSDKPPLTGP